MRPDRYSKREVNGMDVIDLCKHWNLNFNGGNILKYLLRDKGEDIQDLEKIINYANREIMHLKNEFNPIRDWAKDKGILENGTIKGQYIKLLEEVEELNQAIKDDELNDTIDAIGDCVVVLTNLSALIGVPIEYCINSAYSEIKNRKGVMENGTFVKQ